MLDVIAAPTMSGPLRELAVPAGRFDPFRPLSAAQCEKEISAYHAYLRKRDGEVDWEGWSLPRREDRLRELRAEPVRWSGEIDVDAFYQHFHRVGAPEVDLRTHWAVLAAIANESERFGVELEARRLRRQGRQADPVKVYHVLQEDYHTALLLEACRTLGLGDVRLLEPRPVHRWVIRAMAVLPDALRYVLIIIGEAMGSVVLKRLHDTCQLFADDSASEARLRSLLAEIVDDERLHAVHCRARLGKWGLAAARGLIPIAARVTVRAYPQIARLGLDHRSLVDEIRKGIEVPAGAWWVVADSLPEGASA